MFDAIANSIFSPEGPTTNPQYQPPKREWVGLTDEEINAAASTQSWKSFARAIEAKLKEKNT